MKYALLLWGSGACRDFPLGVLFVELIAWYSGVVRSTTSYVVSGASYEGLQCR